MQTVKIKRDELLKRIKDNRDKHRELFLKAQEGYRELVIEELDKMLKEARDGKKPIRTVVQMPAPEDHTNDYDRVIDMLELSVDEIISISSTEFDMYMRDNWTWKGIAMMRNTAYAAKRIPAQQPYDLDY